MTQQPTTQPLNLDEYETAARNAARIGSGIDPAAVLELATEIRRLHAELAATRATTLREAAGAAEGAVNLFEDSDEGAAAAGALEGIAIRFRRMADAARPSAVVAHVVADDSSDPEHAARPAAPTT